MRLTRQRQLILDILRKPGFHPTAVEVFDEVRKQLPTISLGTVYRNLEILCRQGRIRKIETCGDQKRFDATPGNHLHVICSCCGRVQDVENEPDLDVSRLKDIETEFTITGVRLELLGLCPECSINSD